MDEIKNYTQEELNETGERLFGKDKLKWKVECPMCKHPQSVDDYIERTDLRGKDIEKRFGWSCIGRSLKKQEVIKSKGDFPYYFKGGGCNWTLGGFFQLHKATVENEEGKPCPCFDFAFPKEKGSQ